MSVQFILGENPHKKRKQLIHQIHGELTNNSDTNIIYLVPDNVKYETEIMVLGEFKELEPEAKYSGMIRLQVFSFSRLAWYLLQNKAIYQQPQLTESGLSMLVKRILQAEEQNLTIFRGASQQSGFIERLVKLFSELRNGKISPEDLSTIAVNDELKETIGSNDFKRKMDDLSLLYRKYDEALDGKYIVREDLFHALIDHLKGNKELLENTIVIVDHYEHFSAHEQELLVTLGKYSKKLLLSLTMPERFTQMNNDLNNMFYRPVKTYHQLVNELQVNKIAILGNIVVEDSNSIQEKSLDVQEIYNYWIESSGTTTARSLNKYKLLNKENIELWAAEDPTAELVHIATKIKRMVASGNYRYNDFQIMTRDIENCALSVETSFIENEIPFFIDHAESMSKHPILEFVTSLFALKRRHYRLDDVIRFLRTELFVPEMNEEVLLENNFSDKTSFWRQQVDIAENVALAYGYKGSDWTKDEEWIYARFELEDELKQNDYEQHIQSQANFVRKTFKNAIVPFLNRLTDDKTNREIAIELYQFMADIGVIEELQKWRDELIGLGELTEAREHEQAWDTFILILDEFVEVLGEEKWDIDLFVSIMETGFEEATFGMVPPAIDQVLVTNYDLPKIQAKKVVFLIGLTDTQLPQVQGNRSLLTDEDREIVEHSLSEEKYLAVSEMESIANEPFTFYLALLQAEEKIIFSYPMSNSENSENRISPYLERIRKAFDINTQIKHSTVISNEQETFETYNPLQFIGSNRYTFGQIVISLRQAIDLSTAPSAFWLGLFKELYDPRNTDHRRIVNSLFHKNIPKPLTEELAEELYGKDLYLSVSQLETFYADPFSHFLLYGLRLKERQIQELSPLESGNFYHDALDLISHQLLGLNTNIAKISTDQLQKITSEVFNFLLDSNKYRISKSSNRMNFIFRQLTKTVQNMVQSMIYQAKRSKYRINKTELVFGQLGQNQDVTGLTFDLENGRKLHLRGKVDRIDTFEENNQLYAGIVDYKSSKTSFNYQSIYYGLMLQMITYLDTVLTFSENIFEKKAKGIGAFYSQVSNHFVDLKKLGSKELEFELMKNYKLDGLIINQQEVLEAADTEVESGFSALYPFRKLVNDKGYSGNKILTNEEFKLLMKFNRAKIIEAGNSILAGDNKLHPFNQRKMRVHTPSITGPFKAISQFDALLPENNYRDVNKINKDDFFNFLQELYPLDDETDERGWD